MILITIALVVSTAVGSAAENAKLLKTNRALRNVLREIQVGFDEVEVGCPSSCKASFVGDDWCDAPCLGCDFMTTDGCIDGGDCGDWDGSVCGPAEADANDGAVTYDGGFNSPNAPNCGELISYKSCTGNLDRGFDVESWSRRNFGASPVIDGAYAKSQALCQQRCDNFGVPGCCEFQMDYYGPMGPSQIIGRCMFYPGTMSSKDDSGVDKRWSTTERKMVDWPKRWTGICNIPNCEYNMVTMGGVLDPTPTNPDILGLCDKADEDKYGYKFSKVGGQQECNDLCMADPDCYVAAYRSGDCHRFLTCSTEKPSDGMGTMSYTQKVCKGAEEEFGVPGW